MQQSCSFVNNYILCRWAGIRMVPTPDSELLPFMSCNIILLLYRGKSLSVLLEIITFNLLKSIMLGGLAASNV